MNTLQDFKCQLSSYIAMQFRNHLPLSPSDRPRVFEPELTQLIKKPRSREIWFDSLDYEKWLSYVLNKFTAEIADTFWSKEELPRALSKAEIRLLQGIAFDAPMRFDTILVWFCFPELHARTIQYVPLIRKSLTPEVANDWMRRSNQWAKSLCESKLRVAEGIEIVEQWINFATDLELLIEEGNPKTRAEVQEQNVLKRIRELFAEYPKYAHSKPQVVISKIKVQNDRGRKMLRVLAVKKEYFGFTRNSTV